MAVVLLQKYLWKSITLSSIDLDNNPKPLGNSRLATHASTGRDALFLREQLEWTTEGERGREIMKLFINMWCLAEGFLSRNILSSGLDCPVERKVFEVVELTK
jgi:hypothetical protein